MTYESAPCRNRTCNLIVTRDKRYAEKSRFLLCTTPKYRSALIAEISKIRLQCATNVQRRMQLNVQPAEYAVLLLNFALSSAERVL